MYQTVGHDAVHAVAAAMDVPLYRRPIQGTPLNQSAEYGARRGGAPEPGDETEDLYALLRLVKEHHPEADAVSAGAILSNYQRVRVEHVALRPDIALQPLAFLWMRNQSSLLAEMVAAGLDAMLIKVAGAGLTERDLGRTLAQLQPKLERLHEVYDAHVCGEGGEYETLTLDSPLFRRRLANVETEPVILVDDPIACVAYLRMRSVQLAEKGESAGLGAVQPPPVLDGMSVALVDAAQQAATQAERKVTSERTGPPETFAPPMTAHATDTSLVAVNLTADTRGSPAAEVDAVLDALEATLRQHDFQLEDVAHINLYLATQQAFPEVNATYVRRFGSAPPSRACVAVPMGAGGAHVALDAVAHRGERRALHVQSQSYWAPANIGPYSQAVQAGGRTYIAGQIGLLPASMRLECDTLRQAVLALQHVRRIALATREWTACEGHMEGGVAWVADERVWAALAAMWLAQDHVEVDEERDAFPHQQRVPEVEWLGARAADVPVLLVRVARDALPRGALAEWQLTATGDAAPETRSGSFVRNGVLCTYRVLGRSGAALVRPAPDAAPDGEPPALPPALHRKVFYRSGSDGAAADRLVSAALGSGATSWVPALDYTLLGAPAEAAAAACAWIA